MPEPSLARGRCLAPLLFATAALVASPARAQTPGGIALDQLHPTPAGDTFAGVPSPFAAGHLVPRGVVMFDYAARPMTVVTTASSTPLVSGQGYLHVGASLALWDRLLISLAVPIVLVQSGDSPSAGGISFKSPSSQEVGDLRVGARFRFVGDDGAPFQLGASADFFLPTAPAGSFAGEPIARIAPSLVAGGRASRFVWSAMIGGDFHGAPNPTRLVYGAAGGAMLAEDRVQVGAEIFAATPVQDAFIAAGADRTIPRSLTTNLEILLDLKVRVVGSLYLGAGAGPGLTDAIGTPSFRALGSLAWAPPPAPPAAEGAKGSLAERDPDEDGIVDREDACPFAWGAKSADPKRNGCPVVDTDEDGVADPDDACPDKAGVKSADTKKNGCPADRDGDGTPDLLDACPDQKGDAALNGCPAEKR